MREEWTKLTERHRGTVGDLLLAAAVLAFTIPMIVMGESFSLFFRAPPWLGILAASVTSGTMLLRRRTAWPMIIASAGCAVLTGQTMPLPLACYSMTAQNTVRRWQWVAGALMVVYYAVDEVDPRSYHMPYLIAIRALALVYLPALVGTWVRDYCGLVRKLRAGTRLSEERAASRERRWIAGELHDTVTHAVTAMVLNAGMIPGTEDPAEVRDLATTIEDKGVQALTELRDLLTVLRHEEAHRSEQGVEALPPLVEEARATGLRVSLHLEVPPGALPAHVGHTCFRVVQEGLNNARKHAPGSDVQVTCRADGGVVRVSVVNSGKGWTEAVRKHAALESGYGLVGLRERVALAGGRLIVGSTPEGGFALRARIPFQPSECSMAVTDVGGP
jgi:signal transduction histidine kinase